MSGHSKWSTIKRKKEKIDGKRAAVFTKIGREIAVSVKEGGPTPENNSKLRDIIAKAKAANVPNDNIERAIKKASDDKADYEEIMYEGYGPSGVAVIVECLTDNRNRTAGDLRHFFDKFGGNLGQSGSVSFMFNHKGVIVIDAEGVDEETFMEQAMESGAEDYEFGEEAIEVTTSVADFRAVREYFEGKNYSFLSAQVEYVPTTLTALTSEDDIKKMNLLIDNLEEDDDVQNVWHNWDEPDEE